MDRNPRREMDPEVSKFLMPWEYNVCSDCLRRNPHAIWLVKCRCIEPQQHGREEHTIVTIDHERMEMVTIRPLPHNHEQFRGEFVCQCYPNCRHGTICRFAHSKAECDTWNIKKRILRANVALVSEMTSAGLWCQSPTEVCKTCLEANPRAIWLAWLKCIHPEKHHGHEHPRVTAVVVESSHTQMVKVRQPLMRLNINQPQLCRHRQVCSREDSCLLAHSKEEINYWKWKVAKEHYNILDPEFLKLCMEYEYPDEDSESVLRGVECSLTSENYKSKFHRLVYLDDLEHTRKMIQECDGNFDIDVPPWGKKVHLIGMDAAAMDYALQNHATAKFAVNGRRYSAMVITRDYQMGSLIIEMPGGFFHSYRDCVLEDVPVHFEINHWYFWRLHCAIEYVTPSLLQKLLPNKTSFRRAAPTQDRRKQSNFRLDAEYQSRALKQMLSCEPGAPYLLLGPFGTGKTHVLAAAVAKLLENPQSRVLVCTHQNSGADNLYRSLQEHVQGISRKVLRLIPDANALNRLDLLPGYSHKVVREVNLTSISSGRWPVLVTTFLTALYLKDKVRKERATLEFTHIIIDEGAQSREPEALGAVVLATNSTCLIVAGDHQQVGPQVAVYNKVARENGLGASLIERLFTHYKTLKKAATSHAATLLTNYRCHPSILMLASSLSYECTLLSRSTSRAHPKAPFPIVLDCTSFSQNLKEFMNLSAENEREAELLIIKLLEFDKDWPQRRGEEMPTIGLLASSKQQVACLRNKFRLLKPPSMTCNVEIMPTYIIAGQEFSAVFLSTHEPTDSNGYPRDLVRSVCNEYVFNTIVTRAKSLIYATGNPFLLHHMGKAFEDNCWAEYIQRCLQCQTLILPQQRTEARRKKMPELVEQLSKMVFPGKTLDQAMDQVLQPDNADTIIERYIEDLQSRREFKIAHKLVQNPKGQMIWEELRESDSAGPQPARRDVIWCKLDCKDYRNVTAYPTDTTKEPIKLEGVSSRRLGFHDDVVPIDTVNKCVLLDADTEKALSKTHFGASFLCRVDPKNPIQFFPLDKRYPKFVNLPTLTRREADGVVCFDPKSINSSPKMNNFIPMECAVKMLFVVKFLGWQARFAYPLGIIVGAMPAGYSVSAGDLVLRIVHNIPFAPGHSPTALPSTIPENTSHIFKEAFTIDPDGSSDHDDALTCAFLRKDEETEEYQIGVHITNVQKYIPIGGELDKAAMEKGCSVYRSPDNCISPMLPETIIQASSIDKGKSRDAFSIVTRVTLKNGTVQRLHRVAIMESQIESSVELTYQEAQAIMAGPSTPPLKLKLQILLKVASFLRNQRLGNAGGYHSPSEPEEELCLEAHFLVAEFMIWANHEVATRLVRSFPMHTIVRVQPAPNEGQIESILQEHAPHMASSLYLQKYVPPEHQSYPSVKILSSTLKKLQGYLANGKIREALHFIQFEHIHPQLAVVHALFRFACSRSSYCLSGSGEQNYIHDSLSCEYYTHFTSPIRRFIDIVIQRLLHAALNSQQCPYEIEQLNEICDQATATIKRANDYEHDITKLILATELQENSKTFPGFVTEVKDGKLKFCFSDLTLKVLHSRETTIHLKCLNASTIPSQEKPQIPPKASPSNSAGQQQAAAGENPPMYSWKAKVASVLGIPGQFLGHPDLEFTSSEDGIASEPHTKISFFIPESSDAIENVTTSHLTEHKCQAKIKPLTTTIPQKVWKVAQACLKEDPQNLSASALRRKFSTNTPLPSTCDLSFVSSYSPLWIYKIYRPVQTCEVLCVQMSAVRQKASLAPCIQLLEVGPGLSICIQHNDNPAECFTDKLTADASKKTYANIQEYFQFWEQVILAEAAVSSITDSELLFIKDVPLIWPKLVMQTESSGQVYYQLHIPEGHVEAGVCMKLPEQFVKSSYDFFKFSEGDLACVRYDIKESAMKFVFHMVVYHVKRLYKEGRELVGIEVYLKFVGQNSNYISSAMRRVLTSDNHLHCEVQLISLSLPYQRIYHSLCELVKTARSHKLAEQIALGIARTGDPNPSNINTLLQTGKASLATSLWPLTVRPDGRGRVKLNKYQRKAIDLAYSNKFVMIQGPPGTGKSVTGAHIAYALAMKLQEETRLIRGSKEEPRPCVMYCGPSQQSVNVVLNILTAQDSPVRDSLTIVRVYSKAIERKDFPGPKHHTEVFRQERTDARCDLRSRDYALHYLIRDGKPEIERMDKKFEKIKKKIPSGAMRGKYRSLVHDSEVEVLRGNVDIVLCTCNEASSHRIIKSVRPTYCIIDECAMATEPECMVPIRLAEHVVLIGDHNQLQPVLSNRDAKEMGLGRSLFERYMDEVGTRPHMLQIQYRMHEALCEFPSWEFYEGKLVTDNSIKYRKNREAQLHGFWPQGRRMPFAFCDVIGKEAETHTGQKEMSRVGLESKYNVKEAQKIVEIMKVLIDKHTIHPRKIAALTPYSAQREEIRKQMKKKRVTGVEVKTITESQGSEYGIVLLSTVRSRKLDEITTRDGKKKKADIGWLRANLGFITDRHQICVGITRCKYGLVIVGNKVLLSYDHTWNALIEHYKRNGCLVSSRSRFPY